MVAHTLMFFQKIADKYMRLFPGGVFYYAEADSPAFVHVWYDMIPVRAFIDAWEERVRTPDQIKEALILKFVYQLPWRISAVKQD